MPSAGESVPLVDQLDRAIGTACSRAVALRHRRRLARRGWLSALDAPPGGWAGGDPAPRGGNAIEVLVDGAEALPRIASELRGAQSHVHLTGWFLTPGFALTRDGDVTVVRNLLAELAERVDVRVLLWAGAPLPLFRPSRKEVREVAESLRQAGVHCALDARERPLHCHHEKTIVIDDRVAFVGGIDLTDQHGDRFDASVHPGRARVGWHDATTCLRGPAVADVAEHFRFRWHEVTGEQLARPELAPPAGETELQVVRTVPEGIYTSCPRGDFRILESYVRALRAAERLVYLENQFLWSPELTEILAEKLRRPPRDEFRLLVVLPAAPYSGNDDTRGTLAELVEADAGAGRFLACTLYARSGALADPVYVHAKIGIVDDRWLTVGSANLNEHSLLNDTEMNVVTHDAELARATRLRLWAEHLECGPGELTGDPTAIVDEGWNPISAEQLARRRAGEPLTHRLARLPHLSRRSARLLGPLQGFFVDG